MTSWKITLPCTKAEAEAAEISDVFVDWEEPPVLTASEPDEYQPDAWELVVYVETQPNAALLSALKNLAPSAAGVVPRIDQLGDEDWVTLSQAGITPISAGRFYVHTPHFPPASDQVNFMIDAGLAFGTGQHATTSGCLWALDALASAGERFNNILDLGTGTGLLAFTALKLWPSARVTASDIDPVSIEVSLGNAAVNHIAIGEGEGAVALVVADGIVHRHLSARAPYDMIIANILAQPLIEMAADIAGGIAVGGSVILSGLLMTQAAAVSAAYQAQGMTLISQSAHGDWGVLLLKKAST